MFGRKEIIFVFLRYILYVLLALRGFVFAYYLGPFFLGIYGYIMLYQQYLSYTNLGIQNSINYEFAITSEIEKRSKIVNSSITATLIVSFILTIFSFIIFYKKIMLFPVENSYTYIFILLIVTIFSNFQQIFLNIFRAKKILYPIVITELGIAISSLMVVPFYSGIELVNAIFYAWIISLVIGLFYFLRIYKYKIIIETTYIIYLIKIGFPILLYGFSYFLMSQLARTLIGVFYPTEVMGYFSFANNISTAILLGLDTITWIIFPTMISKLANNNLNKEEMTNYIVSFTNKLIVLVIFIVSISVAFLPVLFKILPKYDSVKFSLIIILVNQIVFNSGFVFVSLLIAKKMHFQMALFSLISVAISGFFSFLISYYKLNYIWLVVSNIFGSIFFINLIINYSSKTFGLPIKKLRASFDWTLQLFFVLITIMAVLENYVAVLLMLMVLLLYKFKSLIELYKQLLVVFVKNK